LAALFGCPIYQVSEIVPACEVPLWAEYFHLEPWGFTGQDMIASKTAMYVCGSMAKLKPGVSHKDFMFTSRFESLDLTNDEFDALSQQERDIYVNKQIQQAQMVLN